MPSPFLLARDLVKTYGERLVLAGVSLDAYPGQRLGLVGENGAGKSTLLEILAGAEEPDSGEVVRPADVGFLRQESPFPENGSVRDVVEAALAEAREVERRLAHLARRLERRPRDSEALALYGEALEEAEVREVWDADRRAELVLDEPTNHISLAEELEEALGSAPGAVVVATHDRWLRRRWAGSELRLVAGRRAARDSCSPPRSGCAPRSDPPSFRPRRSTGRPCASGR